MTLEAGKVKRAVTLFISRAWEDKVAFVDPLVEALRDLFELWYDTDSIIPGQGSLLKQISAADPPRATTTTSTLEKTLKD